MFYFLNQLAEDQYLCMFHVSSMKKVEAWLRLFLDHCMFFFPASYLGDSMRGLPVNTRIRYLLVLMNYHK